MKTHFLQKCDGAFSQNLTFYFHHCGSRDAVMKYDLTYIFKHYLLHHLFIFSIIFGINITSDVYRIVLDNILMYIHIAGKTIG